MVNFRFTDGLPKKRSFWVINEEGTVDLCLSDPGFDVDLTITSDVGSLTRVWLGDLAFDRAVADDKRLRQRFRAWLGSAPSLRSDPRRSFSRDFGLRALHRVSLGY